VEQNGQRRERKRPQCRSKKEVQTEHDCA
jgi:hypothetical protein